MSLRKRPNLPSNDVFFTDDDEDEPSLPPSKVTHRSEAGSRKTAGHGAQAKANKRTRNLVDLYHDEIRMKLRGSKAASKPVEDLLKSLNAAFLTKNHEESIQICYELIRLNPNLPDPFNVLHMIYEETGEPKKAVDCLFIKTQLERSHKSEAWSVWQDLAERYFALEEFRSAAYCFKRAFKNNPQNTQLLLQKAECHERMGELKLALQECEKYLKFDVSNVPMLIRISKLYGFLNKKPTSLKILLRLAMTEEFAANCDHNVLNMILDLFLKLRKPDLCAKYLELFVLDSDNFSRMSKSLLSALDSVVADSPAWDAQTTLALKEPNAPIEYAFYFIQNFPPDIVLAYTKALLGSGQTEKSEKFLELVGLKVFAGHIDIWEEFLKSFVRSGRADFVLRTLLKAEESLVGGLSTEHKTAFYTQLGSFYGQIKNPAGKKRCIIRIFRLNPKDTKIKFKLFQSWKKRAGKTQLALDLLRQDDNISRMTAKLNALDDNLSAFISNQSLQEGPGDQTGEAAESSQPAVDSKLVTKLTTLRLFNPEMIADVSRLINAFKSKNQTYRLLVQHERVKIHAENPDKTHYFRELQTFVGANLDLEIARKALVKHLKSKLMLESYKEVLKSSIAFKIRGKGLLSRSHKTRTLTAALDPEAEPGNSEWANFTKKKFYVKKLVSLFLKDVPSVVEIVSAPVFVKYFQDLCEHQNSSGQLPALSLSLGKMMEWKPRYFWKPREFIRLCFQKFTVDFRINQPVLAVAALRQILKELAGLNREEFGEDGPFYLAAARVTLAELNRLFGAVGNEIHSLSSYLHKIFKVFLEKIDFFEGSTEKSELQQLKLSIILTSGNLYFINRSFRLAESLYLDFRTLGGCPKAAAFMVFLCRLFQTASRTNPDPQSTFDQSLDLFSEYASLESDPQIQQYNLGRLLAFVGDLGNAASAFEAVCQGGSATRDLLAAKSALNLFAIYQSASNQFMKSRVLETHLHF